MATSPPRLPTFLDVMHYFTRMVKYWRTAGLLATLGLVLGLLYFVYGKPIYYSRTLVEYSYLDMPVRSEVSDTPGARRYQSISYQLGSGLNSKWLVERTAIRLGLVQTEGNLDYIYSRFINKIRVIHVMATTIQIEVHAFEPRLVREWPAAMLAEYQSYLLSQRTKFMELATKGYADEMERIRRNIADEQLQEKNFEERNRIIESYITQNRIESLPSEMLTIRNQLDNMTEMEEYLAKTAPTTVEKLALLKKYRAMPVPVGTIVQRRERDNLVAKGNVESTVSGPNQAVSPLSSLGGGGTLGAGGTVVVVPALSGSGGEDEWEQIARRLKELESQKLEAVKTYLPGHEVMRELLKKIEQAEVALQSALDTYMNAFYLERDHLTQKLLDLEKQMPEYRKVVADFDKYRRDYNLLTSGRVAWDAAYANLKQRLASMEHTGPDSRVEFDYRGITDLRDKVPVGPNKKKLLLYGVALACGLGLGVPILLERFRTTTSLVAETEKITGLHAAGVIPFMLEGSKMANVLMHERDSLDSEINVDESFRIIRCSLPLYVAKENKGQVIMVTSSRASEGKTTISAHLSRSFAVSGKSTLIIDADLRRGRLHRVLQVENRVGLCEYLDDARTTVAHIVQATELAGLDIIARGADSRPKFEVLASPRFQSLLHELRQHYDHIIIDTPPLLGLADAMMIGEFVDGALLVVRADQTSQRDIFSAMEILHRSRTPVYGFVLNGVDLSRLENYYYYRTYYPRYYEETYRIAEDSQLVNRSSGNRV